MRGAGAILLGALALAASLADCLAGEWKPEGMVVVPAGRYTPFVRVKAPNASNPTRPLRNASRLFGSTSSRRPMPSSSRS